MSKTYVLAGLTIMLWAGTAIAQGGAQLYHLKNQDDPKKGYLVPAAASDDNFKTCDGALMKVTLTDIETDPGSCSNSGTNPALAASYIGKPVFFDNKLFGNVFALNDDPAGSPTQLVIKPFGATDYTKMVEAQPEQWNIGIGPSGNFDVLLKNSLGMAN